MPTDKELIAKFIAENDVTKLPMIKENNGALTGIFKIVSIKKLPQETQVIATPDNGRTNKDFRTAASRVTHAKPGDTCEITYTQKDYQTRIGGTYSDSNGQSFTKQKRETTFRILNPVKILQ